MTDFDRNNVELIKEAWGAYEYSEGAGWDLVSRLATALEDAVMRIDELKDECDAALARIAEAEELHYRDTPSGGGDWCPEDHREWPCPTAVALGLNEGENDEM